MKNIKYIVLALAITFSGCEETNLPNTNRSAINTDFGHQNDFDKFLEKEFVTPYNIEILYKLPDIQTDFNYTLVPSEYEKSIKLANLIKYLCLDAYNAIAPASFLKETFPKQLVFVGSPGYNSNGTILLGTAEGGLKVSLYNINELDVANVEELNSSYFNTIHHEFGHVLHQKKPFSTDFNQIVGAGYIGDEWSKKWKDGESLKAGFISNYSSNQVSDDFVELISHYVLYSNEKWDATLVEAGEGAALINAKMAIIKSYLISNWEIDIDELRTEIQKRYNNLSSQDLDKIN
ncbi:zinc-binding metallopeptidase [Tenacibaculum finnmarkense]|uniref:zinc-binding metallopeptidase n=1 Tax=Tenacibaculum finnmarkense TaxID=2781243 RepID=UPI001E4776F3|nr:putative zinc-binding metallopeptidase [Tenacibaculum finnmarkense]MCD8411260.1 putative zinc-binding metallopeptidase [Tenacibaculum finnmarkense genomovar ulcerans]